MVSSLVIPNYADKKGRKNIVFITSTFAMFVSLGLIFSRSLIFTYFVMFILGLLVPGNFGVAYVMNMEFFPPEW